MDGFMGAAAAEALLHSVEALRRSDASRFVLGRTGGGRTGEGHKYAEAVVRGDQAAVIADGEESRVPGLQALLRQADELIQSMANGPVAALRRVTSRSRPMLACYPGDGSRYVRHLDNPGGASANGRLLTLLAYLNPSWKHEDGGMLRLHRADGSSVDIEPILDRVVVFWSDSRTPHEVLPAQRPRWAISTWYHHDAAQGGGAGETVAAGGDEEVMPAVAQSDMSEVGFGNTTEEIESFLLAMLALKGDGGAAQPAARPKEDVYRENLRSW